MRTRVLGRSNGGFQVLEKARGSRIGVGDGGPPASPHATRRPHGRPRGRVGRTCTGNTLRTVFRRSHAVSPVLCAEGFGVADPEVPGRVVAPTSETRPSGQRRRPPGCAVGSPCEGSGTCAAAAAVGRTPRVRQDAGAGPRRPGRVALCRRVCCFSRRTGSDVGLALLCGVGGEPRRQRPSRTPAAVALSGFRALSHAVPWLRAGPAGGHPPRGFGKRRGGRLGCRFLTLQRSGCVFLSAESESCPPGRTVQGGRSSEDAARCRRLVAWRR